ncbi:MAG: hypothetical protein A2Z04_06605 [Chloroflexi bacterium RBG_16_57_9]|nr:MAG: hypothetical protein A2Z04_06605 [Chloroflexi bacterium RBG_16_57_9]
MYIGHDVNRFMRIRFLVYTASAITVTWEYWDTSGAWVAVPGLTMDGGGSAAQPWASTGTFNLRTLSADMRANWSKTSVNSYSAYWWRARVTGAGAGASLDWIKPHLSLYAPNEGMPINYDFVGGPHVLADGTKAVDTIRQPRRWTPGWSMLDVADAKSLEEIISLATVELYAEWGDYTLNVTTLVDPDVRPQLSFVPGTSPVVFDAQLGIMEQ